MAVETNIPETSGKRINQTHWAKRGRGSRIMLMSRSREDDGAKIK